MICEVSYVRCKNKMLLKFDQGSLEVEEGWTLSLVFRIRKW